MAVKNKMRIYLAYWQRPLLSDGRGGYHVGLILSPKHSGTSPGDITMVYHAVCNISIIQSRIVESWVFVHKIKAKPWPPTTTFHGCMLLGKVAPNFKVDHITEMLRNVDVPSPERAEETGWCCRNWVCDAMKVSTHNNTL
ncbi:hypothetical protein CVT25_002032 [Psilocybe cyanescens]|uniref:Uncharacterized protein n=1 Tax=Psilocybe cyanescens TaxID=93625 RepID=A0A409X070_PSICY|nr:hypothetical protein CVT25_002032 [Psilocybe cyanescens]